MLCNTNPNIELVNFDLCFFKMLFIRVSHSTIICIVIIRVIHDLQNFISHVLQGLFISRCLGVHGYPVDLQSSSSSACLHGLLSDPGVHTFFFILNEMKECLFKRFQTLLVRDYSVSLICSLMK